MTQKLLRVGTSAAVTIPKKSLKELGLKIGDEITVRVDRDKKTVTIEPITSLSPQGKRVAELTLNFIRRYRKDLKALSQK